MSVPLIGMPFSSLSALLIICPLLSIHPAMRKPLHRDESRVDAHTRTTVRFITSVLAETIEKLRKCT
jgi:hypothetical protein